MYVNMWLDLSYLISCFYGEACLIWIFLSELQWGTCRCMHTVQYAYTCTLYLYMCMVFFVLQIHFFPLGDSKDWTMDDLQQKASSALHVFLLYQYQNPWFQLSSFLFIYFMLGEMSLCLCHAVVDITAVTLHGYEWLTYQLYSEEEKTLRDRNRFSLQFKVRETIPKLITLNTPRFSLFFLPLKPLMGKWEFFERSCCLLKIVSVGIILMGLCI